MNLTLKQLFKFGAVCTCACALSATAATNYVEDAFEEYDGGSLGMAIGEYKATEYTVGLDTLTNYMWYAAEGDASAITSNDAAYADIEGDGPITNAIAELILNLETEGNTLSRTAGVAFAESGPGGTVILDPVYVDTLINFTPSEDEPVIDTSDVKVALYVNAQSNLVAMHNMYADPANADWTVLTTNSVIAAVDPSKWYRLTLKVRYDAGGDTGTEIYLDGTLITHPNALDTVNSVNGGSYFVNMDQKQSVELVSFQGTGLLDELVISDTMPQFEETAIQITLVAEGGNVAFLPAAIVDSGTEVTMTADDWERIVTVTGAINEDLSGLLPASSVVTTLTAAADCIVTVAVDTVDGDYDLGGGTYPAADVAAWATDPAVNDPALTEAEVTANEEDDYLLNVAKDTDATIEITSIVVDDVAETVTVIVAASDVAVDFTALNGTLKIYATDDLGVAFVEIAAIDVTLTPSVPSATAVIDISSSSYNFVKAIVE